MTGALDWAKLVFAMMIVGIHVPAFSSHCFGGPDGALAFYLGRGCLVRIAVPGFFAITGFLFAQSMADMESSRERWGRLIHIEKRLCLLWLIWAVPNIPISLFKSYFMMKSPPENLWTFDHFLWGGGYTVAWFIVASMMALPLVWMTELAKSRFPSAVLGTFFYALCLAERPYHGLMPAPAVGFVDAWTVVFTSPVFSFALAYPFMVIGFWVWRARESKISWLPSATAISVAAFAAETYICRNVVPPPAPASVDQNPIYITLGPLVACVLAWLVRKDIACNKNVRRLSVAVMMSHIGFRTLFGGFAHWGFFPNSLVLYVLVVSLSICTGFTLISLQKRFRWRVLDHAL